MAYSSLTFTFEEILTSTKMNQLAENITEVRRMHKGSSQPPSLDAGIMWLDDGAVPWVLRISDGADFMRIGTINPSTNIFSVELAAGIVTTTALGDGAVRENNLFDRAATTAKIDTGAVTEAKLGSAAVTAGKISRDTGSVVLSSSSANFTLPGSARGFYPRTWVDTGGTTYNASIAVGENNTSAHANIYLQRTGGSDDVNASQEYVLSSPPFDMGDGDVRGFVFIHERSGVPLGAYAARVPPWAYNGPTDIVPHHVDEDGRKFRRVKRSTLLLKRLHNQDIEPGQLREMLASPEYQGEDLVEIDHAMKNADMGLIPHPFPDARRGDRVVLLDPMDEAIDFLLEAQAAGESLGPLLRRHFRPGRRALRRRGPPGVVQVPIVG